MKLVGWTLAVTCLLVTSTAGQDSRKGAEGLPKGVVEALAPDEQDYCNQWSGSYRNGCDNKFRANLVCRKVIITPLGDVAYLIENHNTGACGSAGCSLRLLTKESGGTFTQVLGPQGDVGSLTDIRVLKSVTNGHYELQKTWKDKQKITRFKWDGARYIPAS